MLGLINDGWALYDPPKGKVAGSNPAWDTIFFKPFTTIDPVVVLIISSSLAFHAADN